MLHLLPKEIISYMFEWLTLKEVSVLNLCSKGFRAVVLNDNFYVFCKDQYNKNNMAMNEFYGKKESYSVCLSGNLIYFKRFIKQYANVLDIAWICRCAVMSPEIPAIIKCLLEVSPNAELNTYDDIFLIVCGTGKIDIVQSFIKELRDYSHENRDTAFVEACKCGHLSIAQLLLDEFPDIDRLYDSKMFDRYNIQGYCAAFVYVCQNGDLDSAKWIAETIPMTDRQDGQIYDAFSEACLNGYLNVAKWLKKKYPNVVARINKEEILKNISRRGHIDMLRWLIKHWPNINIHSRNDVIFRSVCERGHLDIAKLLVEKFPNIDIHAEKEEAYRMAYANDHQDVVHWLLENYPDIDTNTNISVNVPFRFGRYT